MKQQLDAIINRLATDPYFAVRIFDADTLKVLCTNKTGAQMIESSESIASFFNDVVASGVRSFVIQPRRKNGSSFKDDGPPVRFNTDVNEPDAQAQTASPTLLPAPVVHNPEIMSGLMGGLNAQMIYSHMDYPRVISDNKELTSENKRLKEKIEEMKEAALENRFSESKAQGNKDMLNGIVDALPAIMSAAGGLMGKGGAAAATGLAVPAEPEASPVKQNLIDGIRDTSDTIAGYILLVLNGINTVPTFGPELEQLLINHKLINQDEPN